MSVISAGTTLTTALVQTGDTNGNLVFRTGSGGTTALTLGADQSATFAGGISLGALTTSGNLTFTGTGNRITGDFSNATIANRVIFQTTTTNQQTSIGLLPNGTSTTTNLNLFGGTDPANASIGQFVMTGTEVRLGAINTGSGTLLPMTFYTGNSERLRIDTSGNVGIGTSSPGSGTKLNVSGRGLFTGGAFDPFDGTASGVSISYDTVNNIGQIAAVQTGVATRTLRILTSQTEFYTAGAERMRITSAGDVGIGTASPIGKFQIEGPANRGRFYTNANVTDYTIDSNDDTVRGKSLYFRYCGTGSNRALIFTDGTLALEAGSGGYSASLPGTGTQYPAFFARAWVNFNGDGTVAIRNSGNVSSITDNGTGDYTLNFTTAMPDANYSVVGSGRNGTTRQVIFSIATTVSTPLTTSSARVNTRQDDGPTNDCDIVCVSVFR